jgi:nucleoside phosphorylase
MSFVDLILVPQGAEYLAVAKGLNRANSIRKPQILSIPVGIEPVTRYLTRIQARNFVKGSSLKVLVMGLCGSLSPQYDVGDVAVYQECLLKSNKNDDRFLVRSLDVQLTNLVGKKLQAKNNLVRGLTSDRLIWQSKEKLQLGQIYNASVVDMEGYAVLEVLHRDKIRLATIRVVSDDCERDIPNLNNAISDDGKIQTWQLAVSAIERPLATFRLIKGSLIGLKRLEQITTQLFTE